MTEAKLTWSIWQALLKTFAWAFTCRGFHRFAEWITAMALNVEEHTITQSVLALEQPAAWKALESFAEYGSWHQDRVTWGLTRLVADAPGRIWYGYYVSAVDDTKVHRSSPHVWGTCTFHEYTARCPNRAPTVRATTGWSWAPCSPNPRSPHGSCRSPGKASPIPFFASQGAARNGPTWSGVVGPDVRRIGSGGVAVRNCRRDQEPARGVSLGTCSRARTN